jgi:hypothetical protein
MRFTRKDGEQEMTRLSAILPKGVVPKLAGVAKCTDAAIAAARKQSGAAELAAPSCPATALIGHVLAGAGVGQDLTYVPGSVYLAGPFGGDPLSAVAIVPAVAGPLDVGTVVTQVGLNLNPTTYLGEIDSSSAEPFPRILAGVPLRLRDLRIRADRPQFTLNASGCEAEQAAAQLFGAPTIAPLAARYQAQNCAALAFGPKLSLKLKGATKRGKYPALRAVLRGRPGDANIARTSVALPHSAFLAQEHIRTVCTRVQFSAHACPAGSIYGRARATTPLLGYALTGPVYLRSSSHKLPDLVVALRGPDYQPLEIDLDGRVDSVHGGVRTTFESAPDAPVSTFTLEMQGGKRGLLVNSTNLCKGTHRATANFTGQNGKISESRPELKADCGKKRKRKH